MEWAKSMVGKKSEYNTPRLRLESRSVIPVAEREKMRMPSPEGKRRLHLRFGDHCCFCGIPVIRKQDRERLVLLYPDSVLWGSGEYTRHGAIYAMSAQYDHIVPHSRGGQSDVGNVVLTCLPCNCGRNDNTLEEMGLLDPRKRQPIECVFSGWDGLERLLL